MLIWRGHGHAHANPPEGSARAGRRPDGVGQGGRPALRLRHEAGHPPEAVGQGVHLSGPRREADPRPRRAPPDRVAGHPAGLDRGLDLAEAAGPSPGDRARRQGAQAVPLSPALARRPRRDEVQPDAGLRRRLAADPQAHRGRPGPAGPPPGEGPRRRRPPARDHPDPRRQRGICAHEPIVRPDDHARPARGGRRRDGRASSSGARAASTTRSTWATAASPGS